MNTSQNLSNYLYLAVRLTISYVLLVILSRHEAESFLEIYYLLIFSQVIVLVCDFGNFYEVAKEGIENYTKQIKRNIWVANGLSLTVSALIVLTISYEPSLMMILPMYVIAAYLIYTQKAIFISNGRIGASILVEFGGQPLFLATFLISESLIFAGCFCLLFCLFFCRDLIGNIISKKPLWKLSQYEKCRK